MTEGLFLSQSDSRPMYVQIMEQIKQKVRAGDWPAGHALPSIRELSAATKVSVITVKRAYTELEAEGVIITQQGRGSFVAEVTELQEQFLRMEVMKHLDALLDSSHVLGMSDSELLKLIKNGLVERNEKGAHK